jgi:hypothetical protein
VKFQIEYNGNDPTTKLFLRSFEVSDTISFEVSDTIWDKIAKAWFHGEYFDPFEIDSEWLPEWLESEGDYSG